MPDGTTHVLFTGLELLRRLASLVPPPRTNLTRFHGVFAPGATLRPFRVPTAAAPGEDEAAAGGAGAGSTCGKRQRVPRLDWAGLLRRTFAVDVFSCPSRGGRRRVLAHLTQGAVLRRILRHLQLPESPAVLAPARAPPLLALCEYLTAQQRALSPSPRPPLVRAGQRCAWSATCTPPWGPSCTPHGVSHGPPGRPPTPALARNRAPHPAHTQEAIEHNMARVVPRIAAEAPDTVLLVVPRTVYFVARLLPSPPFPLVRAMRSCSTVLTVSPSLSNGAIARTAAAYYRPAARCGFMSLSARSLTVPRRRG